MRADSFLLGGVNMSVAIVLILLSPFSTEDKMDHFVWRKEFFVVVRVSKLKMAGGDMIRSRLLSVARR